MEKAKEIRIKAAIMQAFDNEVIELLARKVQIIMDSGSYEAENINQSTLAEVNNFIFLHFKYRINELKVKNNKQSLVWARHTAAYLLYSHTEMREEAIGELLKRNRTTIIHSINIVNDRICTDKKYASLISSFES